MGPSSFSSSRTQSRSIGSSCQRGNICTGTKKSHRSTDASLKRGLQPSRSGERARLFRAALLHARQQQTHTQPWSCWQLVAISLLGQISPRRWGWKGVLQSPAPVSTSRDQGSALFAGEFVCRPRGFPGEIPRSVQVWFICLEHRECVLQPDLSCRGQEGGGRLSRGSEQCSHRLPVPHSDLGSFLPLK